MPIPFLAIGAGVLAVAVVNKLLSGDKVDEQNDGKNRTSDTGGGVPGQQGDGGPQTDRPGNTVINIGVPPTVPLTSEQLANGESSNESTHEIEHDGGSNRSGDDSGS